MYVEKFMDPIDWNEMNVSHCGHRDSAIAQDFRIPARLGIASRLMEHDQLAISAFLANNTSNQPASV